MLGLQLPGILKIDHLKVVHKDESSLFLFDLMLAGVPLP